MQTLPKKLNEILEGYHSTKSSYGLSKAGVYHFSKGNEHYYLKIVDASNPFIKELENEYLLYKWLETKYPAPKVIYFEKEEKKHYLLMSALKGTNLDEWSKNHDCNEVVKLYAETLKALHQIDIRNCPVKVTDEDMFLFARKNMFTISSFDEPYEDYTPNALYKKMKTKNPKAHDLVFTHGDYCPDNIMIDEGIIQGVIDIGRGGISCRYKDIALAVRSIRHRFGIDYIDMFIKTYGIENPDWDKIEFYTMMDEFY